MSHEPTDSFLDEDSFFSEIMSSQSNLEDQIISLKEAMDSDRSLEEKLDELLNFLSSNTIKNIPMDILDEKIFCAALPNAQNMYFEVIRVINDNLKIKNTENTKTHLSILMNLLKCWDLCISHIKALEKIAIIDMKSFHPSLFEVMFDALTHCKNSAKEYGDYFQSVSELLTLLFRQCVGTLNSFYTVLDTVISFDTSQETEMNILLQIIDETGKLATLTSGMDIKSLTDLWKRFGKLSTIYNLEMKGISPSTVTNHYKGLSDSIVNVLSSINQKNQRQINERYALCSRVLLKILEKLCETYCGWIRSDVMLGIVVMLTYLHRFNEQYLKLSGYHIDFVKFVITNFNFMIEPFLDVVLQSDTFKVALFDYGKTIDNDVVGYHLLLLIIVKKISMLPYETLREWLNNEQCILDTCFQNIDKLDKDICIGNLQIQMCRDVTQGSYMTNIYEATCLSIFSLVCQISNSEFSELIMLLLKYLLSGGLFNSLLSSDVWCFICRLASPKMCYDHFKYLLQVYEMLEHRKDHLNTVILSNLLSRQYNFLADKDKADFINSITKSSKSFQWSPIIRGIDPQKKKQIQQQIDACSVNNKISDHLKKLEEQSSLNSLTVLLNDLSILEATNTPQDEQSIEVFIKIWNKIVDIFGDCQGTSFYLVENLAISLVRAVSFQHGQTKYLTSILESMSTLYPYASIGLRLEFCHFFNRCATSLTENNAITIADLFCRLLNDEDTCVQQQAFESFDYLTRACPNADLLSSVALVIRNAQSEITSTLPAYISGEVVHRLDGFANRDEFFTALCDTVERKGHVCYARCQEDREEKVRKLDSDVGCSKTEADGAEKRAERVCADVEVLLKLRTQLKRDMYDRLRQTCQKFLDQCDGKPISGTELS